MKISFVVFLGFFLDVALVSQTQGTDAAVQQYNSCHCAQAVSKIESAAKQGDSRAMRTMGVINEDGVAVDRSYLQALRWYRHADAAGDPIAAVRAGSLLHRLGQDAEATTLLQKETLGVAAAAALFELGSIAAAPASDVAPDFVKARELYQRAANMGDLAAKREFGWMLMKGLGGEADPTRGHDLLLAAIQRGDGKAALLMGDLERDSPDRWEAAVLASAAYERAGKNGEPEGYFRAAALFEPGRIRGLANVGYSPNYQRILGWLQEAAKSSDPQAAMNARAQIIQIRRGREQEIKDNAIQYLNEVRLDASGVTTKDDPSDQQSGVLLCSTGTQRRRVASLSNRCMAGLGNVAKGQIIDLSCEWVAAGWSTFEPGQCKWIKEGALGKTYLSTQTWSGRKWEWDGPLTERDHPEIKMEKVVDCGDEEKDFLFFEKGRLGEKCLGPHMDYYLFQAAGGNTKHKVSF